MVLRRCGVCTGLGEWLGTTLSPWPPSHPTFAAEASP